MWDQEVGDLLGSKKTTEINLETEALKTDQITNNFCYIKNTKYYRVHTVQFITIYSSTLNIYSLLLQTIY